MAVVIALVSEWIRIGRYAEVVIAAVRIAPIVGLLARDEIVLSVDHSAAAVDAEALGDRLPAPLLYVARREVDRFARQLTLGLRRGRRKRGLGRDIGPHRLDHRLEDRHCHTAAGGAAAQRAALAVGIVVADPDGGGDVIGEAHEPSVVLHV